MINIKECTTVGLADLGDTTGFDAPGNESQLSAFQLADGVYKRKEITVNDNGAQTFGEFGELSDVNLDTAVHNKPYQFILNNSDVWTPYRDPVEAAGGWNIDMQIIQPYVATGKNEFKKLPNSGNLLCSYHTRHSNVVFKRTDFGYVVGRKGKVKNGTLRLHKEIDFGQPAPSSTIILDIALGDVPIDFVEIIGGFNIKWAEKYVNKLLRIFIRIPGGDEVPLVKFSLQGIDTDVKKEDLSYDFIHLPQIQFKRLRYTTLDLGTPYLEKKIEYIYINNIK